MINLSIILLLSFSSLAPNSFENRLVSKYPASKSYATQVEQFLSPCNSGDQFDRQECQKQKKIIQKNLIKKKMTIVLDDLNPQMMHLDQRYQGKTKLIWTPFVDLENGFGLSLNKPKKLNKNGQPVFKQFVIPLTAKKSLFMSEIKRAIRLGLLQISLQGQFVKAWSLKKAGFDTANGILFKAKYYKITSTQSGEILAEGTF